MEVNGQFNSTTAVPSGICLMNGRVPEPIRTLSLSGIKLQLWYAFCSCGLWHLVIWWQVTELSETTQDYVECHHC